MTKDIMVFQDLVLRGGPARLPNIRKILIDHATPPWRHAKEKEREISTDFGNSDLIVFTREKSNEIETVALFLLSKDNNYEVTNIVPRDVRELGFEAYNAALQDFVKRVAGPACRDGKFQIEMTPEKQSLNDWVSSDIAESLRRFSNCANKSTGSSHPSDRKRWFEVLFAAHESHDHLDPDQLIRWLIEVENWPEEKAHDLAIQYEFGLDLLKAYDKNQG